jgi:hypothetical protein
MLGRICPYCKERVKRDAVVCRHCHRDLNPSEGNRSLPPVGIFAAFIGMAAGVAFALLLGYYKERLRWRDEEYNFPGEEDAGGLTFRDEYATDTRTPEQPREQ